MQSYPKSASGYVQAKRANIINTNNWYHSPLFGVHTYTLHTLTCHTVPKYKLCILVQKHFAGYKHFCNCNKTYIRLYEKQKHGLVQVTSE